MLRRTRLLRRCGCFLPNHIRSLVLLPALRYSQCFAAICITCIGHLGAHFVLVRVLQLSKVLHIRPCHYDIMYSEMPYKRVRCFVPRFCESNILLQTSLVAMDCLVIHTHKHNCLQKQSTIIFLGFSLLTIQLKIMCSKSNFYYIIHNLKQLISIIHHLPLVEWTTRSDPLHYCPCSSSH